MKHTIRRSRQEQSASLAASVRQTLERESAPTPSVAPKTSRAGFGGTALGLVALPVAVVLLVLILFRLSPEPPPPVEEPVGVFEIVRGPVDVVPASSGRTSGPQGPQRPLRGRAGELQAGKPIPARTVIDTRPAGGRAALRMTGGASVRLDRDSRVEVVSTSVLRLERGAVYIDAASVGGAVEVRTALGVVRDIGTQFEVRLMDEESAGEHALRVRVREGAIVLERDGEADEASAGEELSLQDDGTVTRATVAIYGPLWDWVLETAPMPETEGRPLHAFLDWVTREGGLELEYADPETAELAPTIVLHGDLRGLTPREAAAMALKSSRLEYRVEDGVFVVGPAGF